MMWNLLHKVKVFSVDIVPGARQISITTRREGGDSACELLT